MIRETDEIAVAMVGVQAALVLQKAWRRQRCSIDILHHPISQYDLCTMSSLAKQDNTTLRLSISIGDTGSVELMTFNTSVSSDHTFNEIQQLVQEHSLYYKIDENNDELIGGDLSNSKELYLVSGTNKNKLTVDMISELKDGDLIVIGGALPTSTKSTESKVNNNGGVQATNTVVTGEEIKTRPTTNADYLEEARTLCEMGILTENEYNELRMVS